MHSGLALKEIMRAKGYTNVALANELGVTSQAVDNYVKPSGTIRVETLARCLEVLGYELVARPSNDADGSEYYPLEK